MNQIFARPFIGAMDGHIDAISAMAKNPNHLKGIFSGSMDGGIKEWIGCRLFVCFMNVVFYLELQSSIVKKNQIFSFTCKYAITRNGLMQVNN